MPNYKTCKHLHDNGKTCESPAVTRRNYCVFHLRHRARQLRSAQYRARNQRFDLQLPPLENMHSVQSAISHVLQALAADMIDPKRAHEILTGLRHAASNFRDPDAWQPSAYATDPAEAAAVEYDDLEAEFGLSDGLDINTPPEAAFPPPQLSQGVILSEERSDESKSRRFVGVQAHSRDPEQAQRADGAAFVSVNGSVFLSGVDRTPLIPEVPSLIARDYAAEAEAAMSEVTPEDVELNEILKTQGIQAMESRALEHQRNTRRRLVRKHFRANYARYTAEAKLQNIKRAAQQLLAQKQAAEKAAAEACPVQGREAALGGEFPSPSTASKKSPGAAVETERPPKQSKNTA